MSFLVKLLSGIVDYGLLFDLLHFHYDRWLYKTITGAINTAKQLHCSPARALELKTFSPGFWKWQHRFLLDAVRQHGFPSLFMTFSPYEWSFPWPLWLQDLRNLTARGPTNLAGYETLHIAHVLEQIIRGYITGSNSNRWKTHLLRHNRAADRANILTYFYRFEFQQRGTVHVHLLVWLKDLQWLSTKQIRADIPWQDPEAAFLVNRLQKSDQRALPMSLEDTQVTRSNGESVLQLYHPPEAFAINLRAYITTLLPTLKCSMDVQSTDGKSMILRYVTSYVSKWQDAYANDALYSTHVTAYQAAYRHLKEYKPSEPEMWLQLSSKKFAWSASRTKRFVVPTSY